MPMRAFTLTKSKEGHTTVLSADARGVHYPIVDSRAGHARRVVAVLLCGGACCTAHSATNEVDQRMMESPLRSMPEKFTQDTQVC